MILLCEGIKEGRGTTCTLRLGGEAGRGEEEGERQTGRQASQASRQAGRQAGADKWAARVTDGHIAFRGSISPRFRGCNSRKVVSGPCSVA